MLPSLPTPPPYKTRRWRSGLEVEVTHQPGDCRRAVGRHWDSVTELSGTEAVRGDLTTEIYLH